MEQTKLKALTKREGDNDNTSMDYEVRYFFTSDHQTFHTGSRLSQCEFSTRIFELSRVRVLSSNSNSKSFLSSNLNVRYNSVFFKLS